MVGLGGWASWWLLNHRSQLRDRGTNQWGYFDLSLAGSQRFSFLPPAITTQPPNRIVAAGQTATFSVIATRTAPFMYQWQRNTGSGFESIPNATSSSYTTPPTMSSDNGTLFRVIISNSVGSVTSDAATLTVGSTDRIDFGNGFTSSGLALDGGAAINGTRLQLTDGGNGEARSAFFNTPVNVQSFVTDFNFQLTNPDADGFTFTIQSNSPTALGSGGGNLGYGPHHTGTPRGIPNSVAVGFQLYRTALGKVSLAGMWTNGASPAATPGMDTTGSDVDLHSGHVMNGHLAYDGTTLTLQLMDTVTSATFTKAFTINIPSTVGGNAAYVGFTAGTGGLTATQDMLNWRYTAVPVTAFVWPTDTPITYAPSAKGGFNDYATFALQSPILGQYHAGIDVCPQSPGCSRGSPVYATSSGIVELALVVNASAVLCDGSSASGYPINPNTSNLGNVLVIAHPNGKFSLYGHLDCITPGIVQGQQVAAGTRIGNIGNSAYGTQHGDFTPHVHLEMKDAALTGDPDNLGYSGYTTDLPDGYGYHDPRIYINPFLRTPIAPTVIKVVAPAAQNVRTGPATSFASLTLVAPGQEFVAFASSGSWYQIYLPNDVAPISGWVEGSSGSQTFLTLDATAIQLQVTGASALTIFPTASSRAHLVSWGQTVGNCAPSARIWNGQRYVRAGSQGGFNEFYLPLNYYFSSVGACAEPSAPGPSVGWANASFLH